jgi:hypothetical protein
MILLFLELGRRNKRAGYQKAPRRPLLAELSMFMSQFEEDRHTQQKPEPGPKLVPVPETPVDQLVSLSLAVQSEELPSMEKAASKVEETLSEGVTADR